MDDLIKANGALTATPTDPYLTYSQQISAGVTFLKFVKTEFVFGRDGEVLSFGTRLVANMAELQGGWIKWINRAVVAREMVRIDEKAPLQRKKLGDLDDALWERDGKGEPRDPWSNTHTLPLMDPATAEEFLFTTNSKGGNGAIAKLCRVYGNGRKKNRGKLAVIELGSESYLHPEYGKLFNPVFRLVAWVDEQTLIEGGEAEVEDPEPFDDRIPF